MSDTNVSDYGPIQPSPGDLQMAEWLRGKWVVCIEEDDAAAIAQVTDVFGPFPRDSFRAMFRMALLRQDGGAWVESTELVDQLAFVTRDAAFAYVTSRKAEADAF